MKIFRSPNRGGLLSSGRVVFKDSQVLKPHEFYVSSALIRPDGSTVIVGIVTPVGGRFIQVSAATGRTQRTFVQPGSAPGDEWLVSADPTGRFVMVNGNTGRFGWIAHGQVRSLRPPGITVVTAAW